MNRIKELRMQKGLKQIELAKAINVSQAALSGYETGKYEPDFETLHAMATFFSVSVDYLLGVDTKKEPALPMESELDVELITRLCSLTPEELEKVDAFVQGLLAAR